jgi:hypothetical protein
LAHIRFNSAIGATGVAVGTAGKSINNMNVEDLDWLLVLLMRRNWTSLSFTVFSAFLWTLTSVNGAGMTSSLWWMLTLATVVGLGVWLCTWHSINRVNSQISGRSVIKSCNIANLADC